MFEFFGIQLQIRSDMATLREQSSELVRKMAGDASSSGSSMVNGSLAHHSQLGMPPFLNGMMYGAGRSGGVGLGGRRGKRMEVSEADVAKVSEKLWACEATTSVACFETCMHPQKHCSPAQPLCWYLCSWLPYPPPPRL
jgi:hypothetical protein